MEETERKDYIKPIVPAFSEVSNQNVVETVDNKDYISPNNNTDTSATTYSKLKEAFSMKFNQVELLTID